MNKFIYKLSLLLIGVLIVTSCEDNDIPTIDAVNGPTLAQFSKASVVLPTKTSGALAQIDVTVTTKSSTDRVINVEVDPASTATPDQYQISGLVIPANSFIGTITISSNFNALPESETVILILDLIDIDGKTDTLINKGKLTAQLFRQCDIVLADFVGTWSGKDSQGFDTEVVTFLNDEGKLMINGLLFGWFKGPWGEVIVTNAAVELNVNLDTGDITIAEQFYITSTWNGSPQPSYNLTGTGKILNSCQKTMEIRATLIQDGGAVGGTPAVESIRLIQD